MRSLLHIFVIQFANMKVIDALLFPVSADYFKMISNILNVQMRYCQSTNKCTIVTYVNRSGFVGMQNHNTNNLGNNIFLIILLLQTGFQKKVKCI